MLIYTKKITEILSTLWIGFVIIFITFVTVHFLKFAVLYPTQMIWIGIFLFANITFSLFSLVTFYNIIFKNTSWKSLFWIPVLSLFLFFSLTNNFNLVLDILFGPAKTCSNFIKYDREVRGRGKDNSYILFKILIKVY